MKVIGFACALALGGALSYLYATFLFSFLPRVDISHLDSLQRFIIFTQLERLVVVFLPFGVRVRKSQLVFFLFTIEPYFAVGFILLSFLLGSPAFLATGLEIFSTWMSCDLCLLLPYAIGSASHNMIKNRELIGVLLPVVVDFVFLTFLVGVISQTNGTFSLGSFFNYLVLSARSDLLSGINPFSFVLSAPVTSAVVYCSLLVYATLPATQNVPPRVALTFPLFSTLAAAAWILSPATNTAGIFLSFTTPSLVIAALLWWFMRR